LPGSRFLDGPGAILQTAGLLIFPGIIAFLMVLTEY
jgi:hypothetical protein